MKPFSQRFKMMPVFFLVAIIGFMYQPAQAENAGQHPAAKLNLSGLYLGFTPCDDCKGVKTTLALNANNSYVFITQYVGRSDREFVEKGKFEVDEAADKLILTPRKGSMTVQQYLIDADKLVKLDEEGNRISTDGADRYILRRKDIMKDPEGSQHSGH